MSSYFTLLLLFLFPLASSSLSLADYGAIEKESTWETALLNAQALVQAFQDANTGSDRTVLIPSGKEYYMANVSSYFLNDITLQIDGILRFSNNISKWTDTTSRMQLYFENCEGIHLTGSGMVDGQGLNWWRLAYLGIDNRPNMFDFYMTRDITITNLYLYSSPRFSINFKDCADILIHDITIYINSTISRGPNHHPSVTYPLNTDGIDIAAYNVTIYNTNITNYDDGIVAKPCRSNWKYCQCAGNIFAYNNSITYSTGLTIGSVPPNANVNCVRNVTFKDTHMYRPLKALYIKSNPGDSGTGIIEDITYENIFIEQALWWTVWIGPQQQNQPGEEKEGTGCNFLFPFVPVCPTQPLVTMNRITLRNVYAVDTVPLFEGPGVILCNETNPCTNFVFDNVTNLMFEGDVDDIMSQLPIYAPGIVFPTDYRSDDWKFEYLVSNAFGETSSNSPEPCFNNADCWWHSKKKGSKKL